MCPSQDVGDVVYRLGDASRAHNGGAHITWIASFGPFVPPFKGGILTHFPKVIQRRV
jgi:hypothetical protein